MADSAALAGAFAGFVETLAVQPLDLVKTRFQLNKQRNPSVAAALRELVAEGGAGRLYRGLLPELAGNVPTRMGMWAGKDFASRGSAGSRVWRSGLERRAPTSSPTPAASAWTELGAGLLAGLPEAVATTPFQVVKVRMMSRENNGLYRHSAAEARPGRAFERGHGEKPAAEREGRPSPSEQARSPSDARPPLESADRVGRLGSGLPELQPAEQHICAHGWPGLGLDGPAGPLLRLQQLGAGFCGGVLATCCNAPLDVAKSRILRRAEGAGAGPDQPRASTWGVLMGVVRLEGAGALYKGFAPKALRMGIGGAVGVVAYELAVGVLR
ncbi:unnamed protein product [Prorocentrum cordatum]|uniref:Uncharacterized protein n=1 Tax=Prorocentrum cordatum TaxID=2364126 RepID=A0ABN9UVM0_9DINO|nr:unnamed protein product [Polarella glacialis]